MGYVESVLQPGETVLYRARLHWLVYGRALVLLAMAIVLTASAAEESGELKQGLLIAALAALAFAVLAAIGGAIRRATHEYAVTEHRVIHKRGLISRHTVEMNRSKVESVDVDQTLMGRLLGYGTVLVRGTGGGMEPFRMIAHPLELRSHITVG
jgi:uncharacterized membrane protein YdbT with pleckstrin-like domain